MPKPVAQAVMFCLMDVSGSMSEHMKDLAKRFHILPYLFLTRPYRHVEIVFIRHTNRAEVLPCDNQQSRWTRIEELYHGNDHKSANRLGLRFFPRAGYRSSAVNSD
jgi:uncharacterized protein DUF444